MAAESTSKPSTPSSSVSQPPASLPPTPGSKDPEGPIKPIIPKDGILCYEEEPFFVLCKPKLLPIKSVTIEKMEKLQQEAQDKAMAQMNNQTSSDVENQPADD